VKTVEKWATGIFISIDEGLGAGLDAARDLGVSTVHLHAPGRSLRTPESTEQIKAQFAEAGIEISVVFVGFPDDDYSTTEIVKQTVGLVPKDRREQRLEETLAMADFAHALGVDAIGMHLGFVPPDPTDPDFSAVVEVTRQVCDHCRGYGQYFHLETGQETATELLTFIDAVDRENLAVNFDPANMILYGAGDPLEALGQVGGYVRSVHCKDASVERRADQPWHEDAPLGQGDVNIRSFLLKLRDLGYEGPLTIEREYAPDQLRDIKGALQLLEDLRAEILG
jgi:sugar phosphate isomerase/epimerase